MSNATLLLYIIYIHYIYMTMIKNNKILFYVCRQNNRRTKHKLFLLKNK